MLPSEDCKNLKELVFPTNVSSGIPCDDQKRSSGLHPLSYDEKRMLEKLVAENQLEVSDSVKALINVMYSVCKAQGSISKKKEFREKLIPKLNPGVEFVNDHKITDSILESIMKESESKKTDRTHFSFDKIESFIRLIGFEKFLEWHRKISNCEEQGSTLGWLLSFHNIALDEITRLERKVTSDFVSRAAKHFRSFLSVCRNRGVDAYSSFESEANALQKRISNEFDQPGMLVSVDEINILRKMFKWILPLCVNPEAMTVFDDDKHNVDIYADFKVSAGLLMSAYKCRSFDYREIDLHESDLDHMESFSEVDLGRPCSEIKDDALNRVAQQMMFELTGKPGEQFDDSPWGGRSLTNKDRKVLAARTRRGRLQGNNPFMSIVSTEDMVGGYWETLDRREELFRHFEHYRILELAQSDESEPVEALGMGEADLVVLIQAFEELFSTATIQCLSQPHQTNQAESESV